MEAIWADLSEDEAKFESPAWHEEALADTERLVRKGKAKFIDWDLAKKRIQRSVRKNS